MNQNNVSDIRTTPDGQLVVTWPDGHVSTYSLAGLRSGCSCPVCREAVRTGTIVAGPRTVRSVRGLLRGSAIVLVLAVLAELVTAESIVVTGPLLGLVGLALVVVGCVVRYFHAAYLGAAHLLLCAVVLFLININNWGPRTAYGPLALIGSVYLLLALPATWFIDRRLPMTVAPERSWHCRNCNYLLVGLSENRCPECGLRFDPADLPATPPAGIQSPQT